ncbi:hypothetical protein [Parablautia muri]|uniref:Uncharacterized protein n=1 Tax=Parablautia muri TaxID=2320879 RepID=A0A9X5BER1_9FIRM|nr:hypothetical protein [Parablautia muri]NBJ92689.1 hypothetical protein [Parablautia muri]
MMKVSIIKKMMTGALALSLVIAPVMNVGATTTKGSTKSTVEEITASSTSSIPTTSSAGGVKTTTAGIYMATNVNGMAVTTSVASIASGYGLANNEKPYSKFSNLDVKKSPLAKAAIDLAAASQGATVGPMLNIELGKMAAGKYSLLPSDGPAIRISLGIPKNFLRSETTYAVVCVRAGGVTSILADVDEKENTITFDTTGGAGAYAIIRY